MCDLLEHANPRQVISRLEDDEKGVLCLDTLGGIQEVNIINEGGLYGLIFTSRKPEAKAFRRWVTNEVLPTLRRTGRYTIQSEEAASATAPSGRIQVEVPGYGRFTVTHTQRGLSINESVYAIHDELTAIDCRILCHQVKTIEGLWHRYGQMTSTGSFSQHGFSFAVLGKSITDCASVAQHHLEFFDKRMREAAQ